MTMILTDDEQAILAGKEGEARAHAMDLLVRYGKAFGAERLVDTNSVCSGVFGSLPGPRALFAPDAHMDSGAGCSLFYRDSEH